MSPIDKLNNTCSPAGDTVGSLEVEEVSHWGLALWPGNQASLPVCFPFPECDTHSLATLFPHCLRPCLPHLGVLVVSGSFPSSL